MHNNITDKLAEKIFAISRVIKGSMSYKSSLVQLSVLQIQALDFLGKNEHAQMNEIAEYFHIETPSATVLLNKLHDLGLVQRQADLKDRRLVRIVLTSEGKQLHKEATKERNHKIEKILSYLSDGDKNELLRILNTIQEGITNTHEN